MTEKICRKDAPFEMLKGKARDLGKELDLDIQVYGYAHDRKSFFVKLPGIGNTWTFSYGQAMAFLLGLAALRKVKADGKSEDSV